MVESQNKNDMKNFFLVGFLMLFTFYQSTLTIAQRVLQSTVSLKFHDGQGEKVYTYQKSNAAYLEVKLGEDKARFEAGETIEVYVKSETEQIGEKVVLSLKPGSTDVYVGEILFVKSSDAKSNNGKLEVIPGDRITLSYKLPDLKGSGHDTIDSEAWYRGPNWHFFNTGQNHVILIPKWAEISIKGEPIAPGDFISVFYEKNQNDKISLENAAGMGYLNAPGGVKYNGENVAIAVWGTQENKNNGMALGETFKWKIWRAKDNKYYDAKAEYMPIDNQFHISHTDKYVLDGISGINKLIAE